MTGRGGCAVGAVMYRTPEILNDVSCSGTERPWRTCGLISDKASGTSHGGDPVAAFASSSFADLGAQLNDGFVEVQSAVQTALGSSGSGSSGGFGGGGGGAGGGSFGGR